MRELARNKSDRPLRVLDLACGGGDMVCRMGRWARRAGLQISGMDWIEALWRFRRRSLAQQTHTTATFSVRDVLHDDLPADFDVVMCSLFLHHLSECEAVELLKRMHQATRQSVLLSDLWRTNWGYTLTWLGCYLLTTSHICRVDGPRSVAGAFTIEEALDLVDRAGCPKPQLYRHWPLRYVLRWDQV